MAKDKNLFDTVSDQLGKKTKKTNKTKPTPPPAEPVRRQYADRETQEMIDLMHKMNQDLRAKFQFIESKCEALGPNLANYIKDKKVFTPAELSFIEKSKGLLGDKIWKAIGAPWKNPLESTPQPTAQAPTNRKHKTLGLRKKWMPVK